MPGLSRRREEDLRAGRFESEVRASELSKFRAGPSGLNKRVYKCSECGKLYEERSRNCPRCDKRTMGELRAIPEKDQVRTNENAIRRLRSKHGF